VSLRHDTDRLGWLTSPGQRFFQLDGFHAVLYRVPSAGSAFSVVWESKVLLDISRAFLRLLARSAGQQAVQLALYATVSGASLPQAEGRGSALHL
jgi:hypothetical protein